MESLYHQIETVYHALGDRQSKRWFFAMFRAHLEGNISPYYQLLLDLDKASKRRTIISFIRENRPRQKQKIIIFGTGSHAQTVLRGLSAMKLDVMALCRESDSAIGDHHWGLPVLPLETVVQNHSDCIVILGGYPQGRYKNALLAAGFPQENILFRLNKRGKQYFDKVMIPGEKEIFVDAGCLDMKTSIDFLQWSGGQYERIYAFEPDEKSYQGCQASIGTLPFEDPGKVCLIQKGLWSMETTLSFQAQGDGYSAVVDKNTEYKIETTTLDKVVGDTPVTFIKMDIEGSELEALKGARETIVTHHPKMAICIYHKNEDLFDISMYILSLYPGYTLYIRHHSTSWEETVLYCVPPPV